MSSSVQRLARLINEGAKIKAELNDLYQLDVTSDVIAALAEVQTPLGEFEPIKESFSHDEARRDVPTGVQIP